jgi:two-component system OmpR family sensor kinase
MGRLFWKFFFFIWVAQLVTVLGVAAFVWLKVRAEEERPLVIEQSPPASFMVNAAASTLHFGGAAALKSLLESREPRHGGSILAIDEANRELLGRPVSAELLAQARRIADQEQDLNETQRGVRAVSAPDGHTYTLFLPAPLRAEREGRGGRAAPPEAGRGDTPPWGAPPGGKDEFGPPPEDRGPHPPGVREWRRFPTEPLVTGVTVSLLFAAILAFYISRPIKSLRGAFDAAAAGNLNTRVGPAMGARRDELADLGRDFDRMAGRLQDVLEAQRRLLHDVSHEMRSPLARMQAAIGLARHGGGQGGGEGAAFQPEKLAAAMERVEREATRIDRLVGELLTLSRLEAGVADGNAEEVCVDELLADITDDARFEAQALGRHVIYQSGTDGLVMGGPELLHRAFENVIRNAIKHTAPATTVSVTTRVDAQQRLVVTVDDAGPGVPADELADIFTPFFRGSNGSGTEGHGLGLAIARRVLEKHGGGIRASNRTEGGLRVEMILPLAHQSAA